jgi:hypothetical protein
MGTQTGDPTDADLELASHTAALLPLCPAQELVSFLLCQCGSMTALLDDLSCSSCSSSSSRGSKHHLRPGIEDVEEGDQMMMGGDTLQQQQQQT